MNPLLALGNSLNNSELAHGTRPLAIDGRNRLSHDSPGASIDL
ncbi:MAG: hypothetical protein ACFCBW_15065 [Candidatus Competibacterales bacterium]